MESSQKHIHLYRNGLVDDDIYEYELTSPYSWIVFGRSITTNLYIIYMVGTENEQQRKGHATHLLDVFFRLVKKAGGVVKVDSYTSAGEIKIHHVIERMAQQYGVKLVK